MPDQQPQITLDQLVLTAEDYARIDAILGTFPYKSVLPIYDIFDKRIAEQVATRYEEIEKAKNTQKAPELTALVKDIPVREGV